MSATLSQWWQKYAPVLSIGMQDTFVYRWNFLLRSLFSLVPPGQILWASDNPYGQPLHAAAFQIRYALVVGLDGDQIRTIAGGQIERILAGEEPLDLGPAPGPPGAQDPGMERVVSHLMTAMGRAMAEGDPSVSVALGRLAVDLEGPERTLRKVFGPVVLTDAEKGHLPTFSKVAQR